MLGAECLLGRFFLNNCVYSLLHPLLNANRLPFSVQKHGYITLIYSHLAGKVVVCNAFVVHFPDKPASPFFWHHIPSLLFKKIIINSCKS